jgi:capsule biosynthesis phosphatase
MIQNGSQVDAVFLPDAFSIGTDQEILFNSEKLTHKKLRVVVDLDNTLVTLGDSYSNVEPIPHMVKFIRHLKSEGHEVVIHTARGMLSSSGNIGKLTKNIGRVTLDYLDRMGIPYDEIVFGKPYGDIYIDDKAFNTYQIDLFKDMGFYNYRKSLEFKFSTNRYNRIIRIGRDKIMKTGPNMAGEIYFYRTVQSPLLPTMYSYDDHSITTEYINGTSLDNLYAENLLQGKILMDLIRTVQEFHGIDLDDSVDILPSDIHDHYMGKFDERAALRECYPFEDFDAIRDALRLIIEREFMDLPLNNIIHGDLWFSNIILYKGKFVFLDMRGKFGPKLTIKGNAMYDWAKLYQSIVGLDMILSRDELPTHRLDDEFFSAMNFSPENITILRHMTAYTIFCTFPFYCDEITKSQKDKIWKLVKECL